MHPINDFKTLYCSSYLTPYTREIEARTPSRYDSVQLPFDRNTQFGGQVQESQGVVPSRNLTKIWTSKWIIGLGLYNVVYGTGHTRTYRELLGAPSNFPKYKKYPFWLQIAYQFFHFCNAFFFIKSHSLIVTCFHQHPFVSVCYCRWCTCVVSRYTVKFGGFSSPEKKKCVLKKFKTYKFDNPYVLKFFKNYNFFIYKI